MYWHAKFTLYFSLFSILIVGGSDILKTKYVIVHKNDSKLEPPIKLNSFEIENFIQNWKILGLLKENETVVNVCEKELYLLQEALNRSDLWALKMLDASSKIPVGILKGNLVDLGMYDECMAIHEKVRDVNIHGRHCMYSADIFFNNKSLLPSNPTLSICVPSNCNADDLSKLINGSINAIGNSKGFGVRSVSANCSPVNLEVWDMEFVIFFSIFIIIVGFLVFCSIYDTITDVHNGTLDTIKQFSLRRNASLILSTKVNKESLPAIHGLRVFSMAWVVLGHNYVQQFYGISVNKAYIQEWRQSWNSLHIFTAPFAVDTFFTVSGFLMTYLFLKQIPKQKRFNVPMYYLHRYLRLTPAVIALLIFSIVFMQKIGSGPRWYSVTDNFVSRCRTKWWPMLLYVQNFVDKDNFCLAHLWYLAVDMQLFWISPFILYPLYKIPKVGLGILTILFCGSLISTALIIGINEYPLLSFTKANNPRLTSNTFQEVYEMPYVRAGPWLLGILLGYEVVNKNRKLTKKTITIGWLLTVLSFCFCIFGTRYFMEPDYTYNVITETFFSTISRPIWAFGICWIMYAAIYGHAGFISRILSWKCLLPLSRLSYCIYLVHFVIQTMHSAGLRVSPYFSDYYVWRTYVGDLIISIIVAFFFSLLFESPVVVLEKIIFKKPKKESEKKYGQ